MSGEADSSGSRASSDQKEGSPQQDAAAAAGEKPKKPYQKPSFEHERVFETMALACGKISHTQGQCHFNRKNS
jgi:hypothetical protein